VFKLCNGCDKEFPHELVECPVCSRTLVYRPVTLEVLPDYIDELDETDLGDSFPGPDQEPVVHLELPNDETKPQDNGDSVYPE
jgi:hypothetical protein